MKFYLKRNGIVLDGTFENKESAILGAKVFGVDKVFYTEDGREKWFVAGAPSLTNLKEAAIEKAQSVEKLASPPTVKKVEEPAILASREVSSAQAVGAGTVVAPVRQCEGAAVCESAPVRQSFGVAPQPERPMAIEHKFTEPPKPPHEESYMGERVLHNQPMLEVIKDGAPLLNMPQKDAMLRSKLPKGYVFPLDSEMADFYFCRPMNGWIPSEFLEKRK